jgi:hypothetical protein
MITFKEVDRDLLNNGCFFDAKDCVFSEYDNDFYNAKEKIDLDLINEKIRLELYNI